MNLNKVIIIGNLIKNPELKDVGNTQVCKLSLAINRKFKDRNDKLIDEVCFIDVNAWGHTALFCSKYLSKGKPVIIEGRLKQETWERDGKVNSKHIIIAESVDFLPRIKEESDQAESKSYFSKPVTSRPATVKDMEVDTDTSVDYLPF